jgi:T5orf172 domain
MGDMEMFGYVYALLNPGMPGVVKIGRTDRHPDDRAKELTTTGNPHPFVAAYWKAVANPVLAEATLHEQFEKYRVNQKREFFNVDITLVVTAIQALEGVDEIDSSESNCDHGLPIAVEPYLYWMAVEQRDDLSRIGVSDLPKFDLHSFATEFSAKTWPTRQLMFGRPKFFELKDKSMGNDILEELSEFKVKDMPSLFKGVSIETINNLIFQYDEKVAVKSAAKLAEKLAEDEFRLSELRANALSKRL